jgi:hypothetical protein
VRRAGLSVQALQNAVTRGSGLSDVFGSNTGSLSSESASALESSMGERVCSADGGHSLLLRLVSSSLAWKQVVLLAPSVHMNLV